ncbi:hypothetical protein A0J57_21065 [Sphingobium sp. 22B]|nr:hypothetical protein A0J57_21065 [Sphingobium sp. 22B]OAP29915.1 hypothetical protein A8O16_21040 [Sphingobium sp. 20006FA]
MGNRLLQAETKLTIAGTGFDLPARRATVQSGSISLRADVIKHEEVKGSDLFLAGIDFAIVAGHETGAVDVVVAVGWTLAIHIARRFSQPTARLGVARL